MPENNNSGGLWGSIISGAVDIIKIGTNRIPKNETPDRYDSRSKDWTANTDNRVAIMVGGLVLVLLIVLFIPGKK